jgi:RES domain-containing protein
MITAFRLARAEFRADIWSGDGGLHVDGRWHTPGRRIVYTSQSLSLAQLEVLVHISNRKHLPLLVQAAVEIPDDVQEDSVDLQRLPDDWRQFSPYPARTQALGNQWLKAIESAVLKVPSAISEGEWNFLLNPAHGDFARLRLGTAKDYVMDARIP